MNVQDAAYHTVHDYPGGGRLLGERIGKASLNDEVNPNIKGAKFGLVDAVTVQDLTQDYRILYAMAAELRHYPPIPMPTEGDSRSPCAQSVAEVAKDFSLLMQEVAKDLADDKITDRELRKIERKGGELVAAVQHMLQQLAAMNARLHKAAP